MITVTLFTKAGCHLCEDVKPLLKLLQADFPHQLEEVDITQDNQLFEAYRYTIPVVRIGPEELSAPITLQQLRDTLQSVINAH